MISIIKNAGTSYDYDRNNYDLDRAAQNIAKATSSNNSRDK